MPLNTEIIRNGERLQLKWEGFHVSCMYTAAIKEAAPDTPLDSGKTVGDLQEGEWVDFSWTPIYYLEIPGCGLVEKGSQILKQQHKFEGPLPGEFFELLPGDELRAWRTHK